MFGLGIPELIVIFIIALVVFGPKKLPELGKSVGRAMSEFKKAQQEFQDSVQAEMRDVENKAGLDKVKEFLPADLKAYGETGEVNASVALKATEQVQAVNPEQASEQNRTGEAKKNG